jgi:tRNA-dihydrouridine synthase 3
LSTPRLLQIMTPPLKARLQGQMILAPLTRGGNLPFRRLCADLGCTAAVGEMVFARQLLKGDRLEHARLRRASNEDFFGVQIATNEVEEGIGATKLAAEAGADWVDLNCGCPIYEATRRGLGSALLRSPDRLARLVAGIAQESPLPLSVKVRIAPEGGGINVREVVEKLRESGAAAVTIHGRTASARYGKAADWRLIGSVVNDGVARGSTVPIIGNGDILTHFDARQRIEVSGVDGVMVGRGALMKPWIFDEFKRGASWEPTAIERVEMYRRLACYMKEHFRDDARGRKKAWYFLPWHFDFLSRYRPLPEEDFASRDLIAEPLMQMRVSADESASPLERLLGSPSPIAHELIAGALWDTSSDAEAVSALTELAESNRITELETEASAAGAGEVEELTNIPAKEKKVQRRRRAAPPQRTPEEIAAVRAERAAKRARTGAPPHVNGKRGSQHGP